MIDRSHRTFFLSSKWLLISFFLVFISLITAYFLESIRFGIFGLAAAVIPQVTAVGILFHFRLLDIFHRLANKINQTCAKCSNQEPPFFICPNCDENISGLLPSIYGIFNCHCANCQHLVPTTDKGGRSQLKKICSKCEVDITHSKLGKQSEYRFGIVGARSSGKTTLMISAVSALENEFAINNEIEFEFGSIEVEKEFRKNSSTLEKGLVLSQTLRSFPKALTVALKPTQGNGCSLYIYDASGEDFTEDEDRLEKHPIHIYDGILLIVDPFAEKGVRAGLVGKFSSEEIDSNNPAPFEATEVLGRLINVLERVLKVQVGGKFPLPLSIVITKIDSFNSLNQIKLKPFGGWYYSLTAAADDAEYHSTRIRKFLQKAELGNFIRLAESRFARVCYFGVSALGRPEDSFNRAAFKSFGVSAPLVWLAFHTGALTDEDSWERSFANAHINFIRSLRGVEGPKSAKFALIILLCLVIFLVGISFLIFFLMPPLLIALTIGIPAIGLLFLYGWLFAVLVFRRFH